MSVYIKCEKCGTVVGNLRLDMLNENGEMHSVRHDIEQPQEGVVVIETYENWAGNGKHNDYQVATIRCPACGRFPFFKRKVQSDNIIKVAMFQKGAKI